MKTKEKAGTVATVPDLGNHSINTGGAKSDFVNYYDENQAKLQTILLEKMKPAPKIIRLFRCFGCNNNFALSKMSGCLVLCRTCHKTALDKGKVAKSNFTERTLNNVRGFLRRQIV